MMIRVEIFSKPDCHLCDVAKETVRKVQKGVAFSLIEIDISKDPSLLDLYGWEVPVIHINGKKAFKYTVEEKEFIKRIQRCK